MGAIVNAIKRKQQAFFESLNQRDRLIFSIGLDTGLRITDILHLKRADVRKGAFWVKERKTGKKKYCKLSQTTLERAKNYMACHVDYRARLLFRNPQTKKPYTRQGIYKQFSKHAKILKLNHVGTHSMRKTYAQKDFKLNCDITHTQKLLNHSKPSITRVYLKNIR